MFWMLLGWVFGFAIFLGLLVLLFIAVIPIVYCIPYGIWFGWNAGTNNIPKTSSFDKQKKSYFWHQAGNATKLYASWFTHKPHGITRF